MEPRGIIVSEKKQLQKENLFKFYTPQAGYLCQLGSEISKQEKKNLYYDVNVIMSTSDNDDDDAPEMPSEDDNRFLRRFRQKFAFVVDDVKLDSFLIKLYQKNIIIVKIKQFINIVNETEDETYGFEDAESSRPPWKLVVQAKTQRSSLKVVLIPEKFLSLNKFKEQEEIILKSLKGVADKKGNIKTNITKFNKRGIIAMFNNRKTDEVNGLYGFDRFLTKVRELDFKIKNILIQPKESKNKKKKKKKKKKCF